ncbi:MAG TPA: phosphate ABC transporter ATP-binding protein [Candidatus Nanopelagicaceae bacterium]|nr:phosphate ABC transporter ATP-binding protein [Candidatus Nanopelagicaceae bacterium]
MLMEGRAVPPEGAFAAVGEAAVALDDLRVSFGATEVLKGISARISRGKVTALIGPTGCGKTTLLRTLKRLHDQRPGFHLEGSIRLEGSNIYARGTDVRDLRRRMGMLFQRPNPFPQSIAENVSLGARIHGLWARGEVKARTEGLLRDVGLWEAVRDRLGGTPFMLSGGQQQLLCMARALAVEPEVLLLDEPTSSLDPRSTGRIEELVASFRGSKTVVFVTHNLQQAARCADEVLFMMAGEAIEQAPVRDFFDHPGDERSRAYVEGRTV